MKRHAIVHADIKPANIFLTSADSYVTSFKLGDFGLAVIASDE